MIKRFAKSVMVNGLPPMCNMLEYRVRASSPGSGWGPWSDNSAMIQTTAPEIEILSHQMLSHRQQRLFSYSGGS